MSTYRSRAYTVPQKSTKDARYSHNTASYKFDDMVKFAETVRLWQSSEKTRARLLKSNTDPTRMAVEICKVNEAVKDGPKALSCMQAWAALSLDNALQIYSVLSEKGLHEIADDVRRSVLLGMENGEKTAIALGENRKSGRSQSRSC